MPFLHYLEILVSSYPDEIRVAIKNMMDEASDKNINIPTLKKLITKHLDPLFPENKISKTFTNKTTWNSIEETGKILEFEAYVNRPYAEKGVKSYIGETLLHVVHCCPRKKGESLKLDPYDTPAFCYLCWRHTPRLYLYDIEINDNDFNKNEDRHFKHTYKEAKEVKFCYSHNPKDNHSAYKRGKRLFPLFHKELDSIYRYDKKTKAYGSFPSGKPDKRATPGNVKEWIQIHRPKMWERFNIENFNENNFFETLLNRIDRPTGEKPEHIKERDKLHIEIVNDPSQLAEILARCEAWLRAEQIYTANKGGARANSGRKKSGR